MTTTHQRSTRPDPDDPQGRDGGSIGGWASGQNVVFGIWLPFAPFILGHGTDTRLLWHDIGIGLAIILFSMLRTSTAIRHPWPAWVNLVLGGWLVIAPWALGYVHVTGAFWNDTVVGISVILTAALSAFGVPSRLRHVIPG
jgi:hypothetical protein